MPHATRNSIPKEFQPESETKGENKGKKTCKDRVEFRFFRFGFGSWGLGPPIRFQIGIRVGWVGAPPSVSTFHPLALALLGHRTPQTFVKSKHANCVLLFAYFPYTWGKVLSRKKQLYIFLIFIS